MNLSGHPIFRLCTPRLMCVIACILLAGCGGTSEIMQAPDVADPANEAVAAAVEEEQDGAWWGWIFWTLCGLVILMMIAERMNHGETEQDTQPKRWFRANLKVIIVLLSIWAFVSFGCGILLAPWLNQFYLPGTGYKLGFWFAQQGSIYIFVLLIFTYVIIMNQLDRRYGVEED